MSAKAIKGILLAVFVGVLVSCEDTTINDILSENPDTMASEEYWYTRTLNRAQQQVLKKSFGLGFSYDAVGGGKCDMNAVKCQVLNLDNLRDASFVITDNGTSMDTRTTVSHSFTEYCQMTNLTGNVSGKICIYSVEYTKVSAAYEEGVDSVICFHTERNMKLRHEQINNNRGLKNAIASSPDKYLSSSFLYALDKIKSTRDEKARVLVVDSFINIFGTHVVTKATVGGKLILDIKTDKNLVNDYKSEKTIEKQQFDIIFARKSSTATTEEQSYAHQVLDKSTVSISAKGGDVSKFNSIVANPSYTNVDATEETLKKWIESLDSIDLDNATSVSTAELIDMDVEPIWNFIPDETIAGFVKSRIIATAPTMQELYGNRNWVNTKIDCDASSVTTIFNPKGASKSVATSNPWVYNVIAANRHVATVCREWVPEISDDETVTVVYPIYNNKVDLALGLCQHNGKVFHVAWRYDRFEITEDSNMSPSNTLYLTYGLLSTSKREEIDDYQMGRNMIAYEWPGSINADGTINNSGWLTTRKFLGDFYLENTAIYDNLPNWMYKINAAPSEYYKDYLTNDTPYGLCGLDDKTTSNRMVRNSDYTYYINTNEAWYETLR